MSTYKTRARVTVSYTVAVTGTVDAESLPEAAEAFASQVNTDVLLNELDLPSGEGNATVELLSVELADESPFENFDCSECPCDTEPASKTGTVFAAAHVEKRNGYSPLRTQRTD